VTAFCALTSCTYVVNSLVDAPDANPGDNECARAVPDPARAAGPDAGKLCTLRAAVMEANASAWTDTIQVPAGHYHLDLPVASGGGRLRINRPVKIQGAGASSTLIDQDTFDVVIHIEAGKVEINNVTVREGNAQYGGGIYLENGTLELNDSVVRDNFGFTGGGGMLVNTGATATVRRSSFLSNTATGAFGGGLWNRGNLFVFDSTIASNVSNRAGGIRNEGLMNLRNTTISGNEAASDQAGTGGISQNGFAVLNNVTITNNTGIGDDPGSFLGGGLHTVAGQLTVVKNSIIAGNLGGTGPNDCAGSLTGDSKYNLIGDTDGCTIPSFVSTFQLNVDPALGPLGNNGGPTQTHLPSNTSPALNVAYPFGPGGPAADACEGRDQRGVPRPQGAGACDMGAVEVTGANVFVVNFMLVDAGSDTDIRLLLHGDTLDLSELPAQLSIRAVLSGVAGSVIFGLDDNESFQTENVAPYALGGDSPAGNYTPVTLTSGTHTVTATPFAGPGGSGAAGGSRTVKFVVKH
jgi:CSLREA domain-containing protein